MSQQLIERAGKLKKDLETIEQLAPLLPEASDEIEYVISNSSILIYIPYNLTILTQWQERLINLGFMIESVFSVNEYGITVHDNYDKDCCRMVNKELGDGGIVVALWLCPGHPMSSVKKGNIPQS